MTVYPIDLQSFASDLRRSWSEIMKSDMIDNNQIKPPRNRFLASQFFYNPPLTAPFLGKIQIFHLRRIVL